MNNCHNDYSATGNRSSSANFITQNIPEFPMMYNDNDYQQSIHDASTPLSFTEEERFELAMMELTEDDSFQWQKIVSFIDETTGEANVHYNAPVQDSMLNAESGLIPFPVYSNQVVNTEPGIISVYSDDVPPTHTNPIDSFPTPSKVISDRKGGRKKETKHWSKEEHQLLLLGLQKCGKGDWKGISRNYVKTRTPTQIASHAQKYFEHFDKKYKPGRKRRSSIHDTTLPDVLSPVPVPTSTPVPIPILVSAPPPALLPIPSLNLFPISTLTTLPTAQATVLGPSSPLTSVPTQAQTPIHVQVDENITIPVDENMTTPLSDYSNQGGDMVNDNHIDNSVDQDNEWFTFEELLRNC